jgi:hypothetical protein
MTAIPDDWVEEVRSGDLSGPPPHDPLDLLHQRSTDEHQRRSYRAPGPALKIRLAPTKRRGQHESHLSPVPPLQSPSVPGEPFGSP